MMKNFDIKAIITEKDKDMNTLELCFAILNADKLSRLYRMQVKPDSCGVAK